MPKPEFPDRSSLRIWSLIRASDFGIRILPHRSPPLIPRIPQRDPSQPQYHPRKPPSPLHPRQHKKENPKPHKQPRRNPPLSARRLPKPLRFFHILFHQISPPPGRLSPTLNLSLNPFPNLNLNPKPAAPEPKRNTSAGARENFSAPLFQRNQELRAKALRRQILARRRGRDARRKSPESDSPKPATKSIGLPPEDGPRCLKGRKSEPIQRLVHLSPQCGSTSGTQQPTSYPSQLLCTTRRSDRIRL